MLNALMTIKSELASTGAKSHNFVITESILSFGRHAYARYNKRQQDIKRKAEEEKQKLIKQREEKEFTEMLKKAAELEKNKKDVKKEEQEIERKKREARKIEDHANMMMKKAHRDLKESKRINKECEKDAKKLSKVKEKLSGFQFKRTAPSSSDAAIVKKAKQDDLESVACGLTPNEFKHLKARRCQADGNCLFNAVSILIKGNS